MGEEGKSWLVFELDWISNWVICDTDHYQSVQVITTDGECKAGEPEGVVSFKELSVTY